MILQISIIIHNMSTLHALIYIKISKVICAFEEKKNLTKTHRFFK